MEPWLRERGHALSHVHWYAGGAASGPEADWLIVMGGPMGVHDEGELPWLRDEKRALEAALKRGAAILGVCLGAQLVAHVLGAPVSRNREKEIGWFPVDRSPEAGGTWLARAFPARFTPLHWHGDTFGIPRGAVALGGSQACANQGFLHGENVLGLQFHPEITPLGLAGLVAHCGGELGIAGTEKGRFVQDEAALNAGLIGAAALNAMMAEVCERLENRAACV
jgi:GMP synthase-like glutamine amidotransferase